jgi:hypothetical protein
LLTRDGFWELLAGSYVCLWIVIKMGGLQRETNVSCFLLMMLATRVIVVFAQRLAGSEGLADCGR